MGWDTEIVILAENLENEKDVAEIATLIFEKDAKKWGPSTAFQHHSGTLFYHYERRKYAPYWVIQELSSMYPDAYFTILASCPDFVGGPAGLIRISKGQIQDSYGIGEASKTITRVALLIEPLNYVPIIHQWFGTNGPEEMSRMEFLDQYPKGWCNDNYVEKIIPIPETEELQARYHESYDKLSKYHWTKLVNFQNSK